MKNFIQNIKQNLKLVIGVLVIGLFLGWLFFHQGSANTAGKNETELTGHEGHDHESEDPTIWTCSMHPQIKQDEPGQCPICAMDLIPLVSMSSGGEDSNPNEIMLSESAAKLASIQTMKVAKAGPVKTIYLQGKIQADERNIAELTARYGGRIEKLFVNFTGQNVRKGEKLATIYSPELVTAQRELLEAISFKETRPSLYTAAKAKLKLWEISDDQISAIEENGEPLVYFDILSPITGTITMRMVSHGDYIKEGNALFTVIDLTKVWAMFDAYESDLPWIKIGDKVDFTVQALPGKTFTAKAAFIDLLINSQTRVAKVRVEVSNPKLTLKPEMFASALLESKIAEGTKEIMVPKSAVLWTGKRAVVYVKVPDRESPTFLYRQVILGPEAGAFYVISEGLEEGEEIAVNGVFKIDAASQLQGLPSMMNPSADGGVVSIGYNHDEQTMSDKEMSEMETEIKPVKISEDFKKQLTKVYTEYLIMKDAFVASEAHQVMTAANEVASSLEKVDMKLLQGDGHIAWMEYMKVMETSIITISKSMDIEKQRSEFAKFNIEFYKSLKTFGLDNITAYYQYCPMAEKDKGAFWFSNSEEIKNPYFGDMMLTCGENREVVK